jgi:hypothetical protein
MNKLLIVWAGLLGLGFLALLAPPDKALHLIDAAVKLGIPLALCFAVGSFAHNHRGRSRAAWFWLSFFITPVVSFLVVLLMPDRRPRYRWQP